MTAAHSASRELRKCKKRSLSVFTKRDTRTGIVRNLWLVLSTCFITVNVWINKKIAN